MADETEPADEITDETEETIEVDELKEETAPEEVDELADEGPLPSFETQRLKVPVTQ